MENPHNVRSQGGALAKCREAYRHDELIDVLDALYEVRISGATVESIIARIKNEGERFK